MITSQAIVFTDQNAANTEKETQIAAGVPANQIKVRKLAKVLLSHTLDPDGELILKNKTGQEFWVVTILEK